MKTWLLLLTLWVLPISLPAGDLEVRVTGVRNAQGFVRGLVFSAKDGFPEDHTKALARAEVRAKAGEVTLRFKGIDPKHAAVIVMHDEDDNRKLKKNLLGVPREGVAASNWAGRGRPKFQNSVIPLPHGQPLVLKLKYF